MKSTQLEMSSRSARGDTGPGEILSQKTREKLQESVRDSRTFPESAELLGDGPEALVSGYGGVLQDLLLHVNNHIFTL